MSLPCYDVRHMALIIHRRPGEGVTLNTQDGDVVVTVLERTNRHGFVQHTLAIDAPKSVKIVRDNAKDRGAKHARN